MKPKGDNPYKRICIHGEAVIGEYKCYPREILYLNFHKDEKGIWTCIMDDESMDRLEKIFKTSPNIVVKTFGDYDEEGNKLKENRGCGDFISFVTKALQENRRFKSMSTIEVMCENPNVDAHVKEWENRCLKAEERLENRKKYERSFYDLLKGRAKAFSDVALLWNPGSEGRNANERLSNEMLDLADIMEREVLP